MKKLLFVLLPLLFVTQCSLKYTIFKEESKFFKPPAREMFLKSVAALGLGYGYDTDLNLDYVYEKTYAGIDPKKNRGKLSAAFKRYKSGEVVSFYEDIYKLKALTEIKMNYFSSNRRWREYTYMKKYLYPSLKVYHTLIKGVVLERRKSYSNILVKRQKYLKYEAQERLDQELAQDDDTKDGP